MTRSATAPARTGAFQLARPSGRGATLQSRGSLACAQPLRRKLLAQVNLAWARYPLDDPRMAEFVKAIDRINAVGDRSPGCVWRFRTTDGDATGVRVLDDPRILFNLTIWRSVDDLRRYAYRTEHAAFFRRRLEWFVPPPKPPLALWWVPEGTRPTVNESMERLELLWRDGPTPEAFTLKVAYGADGVRLRQPPGGPRSPAPERATGAAE